MFGQTHKQALALISKPGELNVLFKKKNIVKQVRLLWVTRKINII